MPNYWNSGSFYPATYPQYYSTPMTTPQQSYAAPSAPSSNIAATWVESEMEARGRQIPQGFTQLIMLDTSRQKIYWKSLNQMGMPNPMQVLDFTIEEQNANLPSGQSGNTVSPQQDMSQYVTKQDFEQLRNEIRAMAQSGAPSNQNGGNNSGQNGNRGGNR